MLEDKVVYLCSKLPADYIPCVMHIAICQHVRCIPIRLLWASQVHTPTRSLWNAHRNMLVDRIHTH